MTRAGGLPLLRPMEGLDHAGERYCAESLVRC
jgi:hypothetical protein